MWIVYISHQHRHDVVVVMIMAWEWRPSCYLLGEKPHRLLGISGVEERTWPSDTAHRGSLPSIRYRGFPPLRFVHEKENIDTGLQRHRDGPCDDDPEPRAVKGFEELLV